MAFLLRGPLVIPPRILPRYVAEVPVNLQTSLYYVAPHPPTFPPDPPTPQRWQLARYLVDYPPNLQTSVFYVPPLPPVFPPDLPTPQRKQSYLVDYPPNLQTSVFYVPPQAPVKPPDLPTPQRGQLARYVPDNPPNISKSAAVPFVLSAFPADVRQPPRYAPDQPPNLQTSAFFVMPTQFPFTPPDLPATAWRPRTFIAEITNTPIIAPPGVPFFSFDSPPQRQTPLYIPDQPPNLQTSVYFVAPHPPQFPPDLPTPQRGQLARFDAGTVPNITGQLLPPFVLPSLPPDVRKPPFFDAGVISNLLPILLSQPLRPFFPPAFPEPRQPVRYVPDIPPNLQASTFFGPATLPQGKSTLPEPRQPLRYVEVPPPNLLTAGPLFVTPAAPFPKPPDLPTIRSWQLARFDAGTVPNLAVRVPPPVIVTPPAPAAPLPPPLLLGIFVDEDTLEAVRNYWLANAANLVTPARFVDEDTLEAVRACWMAQQITLPLLFPEPPKTGRLKSPVQTPYAVVDVRQGPRPNERMTGGPRHDYRLVTIKVYGLKAEVVRGIQAINAVFNVSTVLVYPSGDRFIRWWPIDDAELDEDPAASKLGQDTWVGTIRAEVWSVRTEQIPPVGIPAPFKPAVPPATGGGWEHEAVGAGAGPPNVPTGLVAMATASSIVLTWNASIGAASYNIKRGTESGAETQYATSAANSFNDGFAAGGVHYFYKVTAVNSSGESALSNEADASISSLLASLLFDLPFNEAGTNATALDATPAGDNFTSHGGTIQTAGVAAGQHSRHLMATSLQFYDRAALAAIQGATAFSTMGWAFFDTSPGSAFLTLINQGAWDGAQACFALETNASNGLIAFIATSLASLGDANGNTGNIGMTTGIWYHCALVFDGTQTGNVNRLKVFLNGAQQTLTFSGTIPAVLTVCTSNIEFGRMGSGLGRYHDGRLQEWPCWNRALRPEEVAADYNAGVPVGYPFSGINPSALGNAIMDHLASRLMSRDGSKLEG